MTSNATLPAVVRDESVDGLETVEMPKPQPVVVPDQANSDKRYGRKLAFILLVMIAVAAVVACVVHVVTVTSNTDGNAADDEMTAEKASFVLQDLMNVSEWHDAHHEQFDRCFETFDVDGDGKLNEEEFSLYFTLELDHSATFETIDADEDKILSFAEVVAYLHAMHSIPEIATVFHQNTGPLVADHYDFALTNESTVSDEELELFMQYVAVTAFFDIFDADSHGYIRHEEYLSVSAANEFLFVDADSDGYLSRAEFFDLLFGDDAYSWSGHLTATFGENKSLVGEQASSIRVTDEMVQNVNVTICPMALEKNEGTLDEARRLVYCYFYACWYCDPAGWCFLMVPCCF